jgi:ribosomal protein L12E/L44/L45/RPP1/RPP2
MKHLSAYMMLVLGGNATPSKEEVVTALSAVGVECDDARLTTLMADLEGKDLNELLASGKELLAKFGSGGGGGGGGSGGGGGGAVAEEEKPAEKEEEEEMDLGGGMDMFGGEEAAGGGDY